MIPIVILISNVNETIPNRSFREIKGIPAIDFLISRLKNAFDVPIVIATSENALDDVFEKKYSDTSCVSVYRGEYSDVLGRLLGAAKFVKASTFVKINGNSPLVDLKRMKSLVDLHLAGKYFYSYNEHSNGVIWGTGCEVYDTKGLEELSLSLENRYQSEMLSYFIRQNEKTYKVNRAIVRENRPSYKVNLETEKDLELINEIANNVANIDENLIKKYLDDHRILSRYNIESPAKEVGTEKLFFNTWKIQDILGNKGRFKHSYPISVELTLTNKCNLDCIYCSDRELRKRQGGGSSINLDTLKKLIDDLAAGGTRGITIEGGGEPTLYPYFSEIVDYIDSKGLGIGVITNGTVKLNKNVLRKLEWIRVSLDASNNEEYLRLKGIDCYERVLSNIAHYVKYCNTVGIGYVVTKNNISNIEALVMRLRSLGASYIQMRPVVDNTDLFPNNIDLTYLECYKSTKFNVIVDGMVENAETGNSELPCHADSITSIISGDGSVYICGRLNIYNWLKPIGNINESSFSEIWNGEERKRQEKMIQSPEFCSKYCPQCRVTKFNQLFERLYNTHSVDFI